MYPSAAYNTVDHDTLLRGITGSALFWFKSFPNKNKFRVILNYDNSEIGYIIYGVPQGTVYWFVLFITCTLTLQSRLNCYNVSYILYVDDTRTQIKPDSKNHCVSNLSLLINVAQTWMSSRNFKFKKEKTKLMMVGRPVQIRNLDVP